MYGVGAVSLKSCLSAIYDSGVPSPLLTGLSRSVGCAFLRNCTSLETSGSLVLGSLRALRIHRRVFARVI